MKLGLFSLFMFFVLTQNEESDHTTVGEVLVSPEQVEYENEEDERSGDDCRYQEDSIPHRDLSDYEVLSDSPAKLSETEEFENVDEERLKSEQSEQVNTELERAPVDEEAQE